MDFVKFMQEDSNLVRTEKGAVAYKSTGSDLLNLFSIAGALRSRDASDIQRLFAFAYAENKLLAMKLLFYLRNIRGGLGERRTFRIMLEWIANNDPRVLIENMPLISQFGRWDDYYCLIGTNVEKEMWKYLKYEFFLDLEEIKLGVAPSLCAKWLKSVNTSSKESSKLGKLTAKMFGLSEKDYRIKLAKLRKVIKVTEVSMAGRDWDKINYEAVPSIAMKNYKGAFMKHDEERFKSFITKVEKGEAKINASTLFPYDILLSAGIHNAYRGFVIKNDPVLEAQWKALPNYIEGENNILVMADTSGSMLMGGAVPIATSIGLAIYFAERNKGIFKDVFMTFSTTPTFVTLRGNTLAAKVASIQGIVASTNLDRAFKKILDVAIENKLPQEQMPKALIIISDMQFDNAIDISVPNDKQVFHKTIEDAFKQNGYTLPNVIYWNVEGRADTRQAQVNTANVQLFSGYSPAVFKSVLDSISLTPYEAMLKTLNSKEYDCVRV